MAGAAADRGPAHPPADAWTRHRVPGDSRGPEQADFAIRRVVASREGLPGPDVWLVLRRPPGADTVRVFLGHAPRRVKPAQLAHLTDARWAIETCFREGQQLLGLGDYEGRSWQGWHRHMTLCLLLHFFLLRGRRALKKTARPDAVPAGGGPGGRTLALGRRLRGDGHALLTAALDRLQGRAVRNAAAVRAHARRRLAEQPP